MEILSINETYSVICHDDEYTIIYQDDEIDYNLSLIHI
jgi:hypothetical protein